MIQATPHYAVPLRMATGAAHVALGDLSVDRSPRCPRTPEVQKLLNTGRIARNCGDGGVTGESLWRVHYHTWMSEGRLYPTWVTVMARDEDEALRKAKAWRKEMDSRERGANCGYWQHARVELVGVETA